MDVFNIDEVPSFITKDGSEIRELLAYRNSCIRNQSLAEARIPAGGSTITHRHLKTEEIYLVLEGEGEMWIDGRQRRVRPGDAIAIPPGASHRLANAGEQTMRILCCCAPPYEDEDTRLINQPV